jgi:DNA ligase-1
MLAATVEDVKALPYPMIVSPKIDGIRALTIAGRLLSRSLKPIPNKHVRETLERALPHGLDGELLSGATFQDCTSAIMSHEGEPDFAFCAFDYLGLGLLAPYRERVEALAEVVARIDDPRVQVVPTFWVDGPEQLATAEEEALARGFEGLMLRRPEGPYKQGRSTLREGWLLKLKRFLDAEATVVGFEELMRNENEAKTNELGLTKRSSSKGGKVPASTLGALILRRPDGVEFGVGAGLTEELRARVWAERDRYLGAVVKYKSQKFGEKDAPRLPVFLGFRSPEDA